MPRFELNIPSGFDASLTLTASGAVSAKPDTQPSSRPAKQPELDSLTQKFVALYAAAAAQLKQNGFVIEPTSPPEVHDAVNALRTFVSKQLFPKGFTDVDQVGAKITPVEKLVFQHHTLSSLPIGNSQRLKAELTREIFEAVEMGPVPPGYKSSNPIGSFVRSHQ